ncbi:MAG: hypothetical protein H0W61_11605 [Bacteroidetes bacterium]|nr:hypothetical protein [Bacteroidota bacterium]
MISIQEINFPEKIKEFIDFPHDLYKGDPNYVPELFISQKDILNPKKHPFFEHSKVQLYLAYNGNKIVGRIAAIRNNNHNAHKQTKDGFFGFFECVNDYAVAKLLFDTAAEWIKKEGLNNMLGPASFSTNEFFGWHIDAFDQPPMLAIAYNKSYYPEFANRYGFSKYTDHFAYYITTANVSQKPLGLSEAFEKRLAAKNVIIRKVNMKRFKEEAEKAHKVYNSAWDKNSGFVPMTYNEFMYLCNDMKTILEPDLCYVAEKDGEFIGFSFSFPDINQVLKDVKRGRLLPFGIFKLLFNRRKINKVRVVVLGVIEGYRKLGIEAVFFAKAIAYAKKHHIVGAEASLILENNEMMNKALLNINAHVYKTYRVYKFVL